MPVMEGKCILFKEFANVDAVPILVNTKDVDEFVKTVKLISLSFGAINLEDISAPRCFEIEKRLIDELSIPVLHDDQHGTAIVLAAGLTNALKLVNKKFEEIKVVFSGAGAAGTAIALLLMKKGVKNLIICDTKGAIYEGRKEGMNPEKEQIAKITNSQKIKGTIGDALTGAYVFIGVSGPKTVTTEMVKKMANKAIVFAMANPTPEIMPDDAKAGGCYIYASGRSDFPNKVNNVLAFPGLFRGALDAGVTKFTDEMKFAAIDAIAAMVPEPKIECIIPDPFTPNLAFKVGEAVKKAALTSPLSIQPDLSKGFMF